VTLGAGGIGVLAPSLTTPAVETGWIVRNYRFRLQVSNVFKLTAVRRVFFMPITLAGGGFGISGNALRKSLDREVSGVNYLRS